MLPLLPALILLLLQGPAGIERMAWNGQLPGAIDALHRQISEGPDGVAAAENAVFASLLAVSSDRSMSRALLQLLAYVDVSTPETSAPILASEECGPPITVPPSLGSPDEGYFTCRRSRDGPALA